jgi:hypothetical protein
MLILTKASAKVPIAGIKMKCGKLSGAIASNASSVADCLDGVTER